MLPDLILLVFTGGPKPKPYHSGATGIDISHPSDCLSPPIPQSFEFFGENETALPPPHSHSPPLPLSHMGKFNLMINYHLDLSQD
jgi:hypothetical protein